MSDTMLLGILRMPLPNNPDPLTLAQFAWRAGQAADRIEHDAAEIKRLRADLARISEEMGLPPTVGPAPGALKRIVAWANDAGPLRAFARDVMAAWPDGDVDGGALQEMAVSHGLLVPEARTEPCGDECECAGYYDQAEMADGVTCYRRGPLLGPQGTAHDAGIQTALGPNAAVQADGGLPPVAPGTEG